MSDDMLRGVIENIKSAKFYAYMADETCDISNTEQLTNFVRWVDDDFCEHEDFIGLHSVDRTNANYLDLVSIIENGKDYSEQLKAVSTFYKGDFFNHNCKPFLLCLKGKKP